ncbi:30S ribosomal protein S7 [candidate division WWE3 bacterium CG08_land_8_20_14_0_20_40_13]|uniref:Small ribosomal subunit protein uS7 n=1 Tax=candidate division WWE3 bacterium CG08_land_8_20_14_0_20_40_13 TaxID=1975084 RepID=A0A2H0XEG9_UNCKA|nr:MAG: 30S ribosomal protein S7 [candidate division WWE3 bacterium CG08_land_8_20_14_0_20_40_13]
MARGAKPTKNPIETDQFYKSKVVTRVVNRLMLGGEKSVATKIIYGVLEKISEDKKEATTKLEEAVKNLMPSQEVRSRRVGGATYQVPVPLRHDRSEALAIRWLVEAARAKKGKPMAQRLFEEVTLAAKKEGVAYKKKEDTLRMADANKAFAHFKW